MKLMSYKEEYYIYPARSGTYFTLQLQLDTNN